MSGFLDPGAHLSPVATGPGAQLPHWGASSPFGTVHTATEAGEAESPASAGPGGVFEATPARDRKPPTLGLLALPALALGV